MRGCHCGQPRGRGKGVVPECLGLLTRIADDDEGGAPLDAGSVARAGRHDEEPRHAANKIAVASKEQRRTWFRALLQQPAVADPDVLATQLLLLVDGAIAAALVRGDPRVARAAREAARAQLSFAVKASNPTMVGALQLQFRSDLAINFA